MSFLLKIHSLDCLARAHSGTRGCVWGAGPAGAGDHPRGSSSGGQEVSVHSPPDARLSVPFPSRDPLSLSPWRQEVESFCSLGRRVLYPLAPCPTLTAEPGTVFAGVGGASVQGTAVAGFCPHPRRQHTQIGGIPGRLPRKVPSPWDQPGDGVGTLEAPSRSRRQALALEPPSLGSLSD